MERAGFMVDVVGDGEAALVACNANPYDAVVVDQTLPGLSGLEVLRALASGGSLPPSIMVTGTGNEQIAVDAMKLGVSDYLVKDLESGFVHVLPLVVSRAIDQRRLLQEKQRMEKELAQAQRMQAIGQLAAGIAHEINTPNQYIGNNARFLQVAFAEITGLLDAFDRLLRAARNDSVTDELMKEMEEKLQGADLDYLTREIPQAIQQSLEGVEHVANIVGAMKEFSHPSSGQKQEADLNRVIEGTLTLCRCEWNHLADVVADFDPQLPLVHCLPTDINRLVVNLMVNAAHAIAKATHNGSDGKGAITVSTRLIDPWAEIRVKDTGAGIPEEIRSRIFDLFFTTKEVGKGTGQGLAIVHAIVVEKHSGTIRFETEVGRGTTFIVRLPIDGKPHAFAETDETTLPVVK
jgi:signal transduction histidine kinase